MKENYEWKISWILYQNPIFFRHGESSHGHGKSCPTKSPEEVKQKSLIGQVVSSEAEKKPLGFPSQKLLMSSSSANKDVVLTQMEVLQPELKASLTKTEKLSGVNCSQQCSGCSTTVPEWRQIRSRRSLLRQASQVRSCGQVPDLLTLSNINWLKVG